ncbi:MAG: phosphopentomutase [Deinococcus sp.]|nr:phosphopentomutase [Deinococcus sp.]
MILDSCGVGALPDAAAYGDTGSHTLDHTIQASGVTLPHLAAWGLGNIPGVESIPRTPHPQGAHGRLAEVSKGKDTTTGHWELMGLVVAEPFQTYPQGFPPEVIQRFAKAIGRKVLGNYPASGTEIIAQLGAEHLAAGWPIVYTSADSVFQIAAHVDVVPLEQLYQWCLAAREIMRGRFNVARVIARPFTGRPGAFVRLGDKRHDYSVAPTGKTVLDALQEAKIPVVGVGKISDIFHGQGITESIPSKDNADGIEKTMVRMQTLVRDRELLFTNLVEFDSLYGHRNDPLGYSRALKYLDDQLPRLLAALGPDDVFLISADHGCDPTTPSTDHSREYVPLLAAGPKVKAAPLGTRTSFADVGATIAEFLGVRWQGAGQSFRGELQRV